MATSGTLYMRIDSLNSAQVPSGPGFVSDSVLSSKPAGGAGTWRRAVYGALVVVACTVILMQHVWYAHELITGVALEELSADPRRESLESVDTPLYSQLLVQERQLKSSSSTSYNILDQKFITSASTQASSSELTNEPPRMETGGELEEEPVGTEVSGFDAGEVKVFKEYRLINVSKVDEVVVPRAIPRAWEAPKKCATVEEMGSATVGSTRAASLRLRAMIRTWVVRHGAERVRKMPAEEFCGESFVLGQALEDGFGNNMYKMLTAAGLAVALNRSLIIAERLGMRPRWEVDPKRVPKRAFGEYLDFSEEIFTVREVRRLWAVHRCETNYNRSLVVQTDTLDAELKQTRCMCDDWTTLTAPVVELKGATGAGAIQLLLKNAHPATRAAAVKLLGNPAVPDSRPNTFGELLRAFVAPNADIQAAVKWALKDGPDPDITLHLRMLHSTAQSGQIAATSCINQIRDQISRKHSSRGRRPRVVVVTDTPSVIPGLQRALGQDIELIRFDYKEFAKGNVSEGSTLSLRNGLPAPERVRDWGEMPRWVAMVDFFLASRARTAVVSGAFRRVSTTYAQLVAALAAASSLDERDPPRHPACAYYSSFQPALVTFGLKYQSGWGFSWRPFGGKLGCRKQRTQCAKTALLPFTWWDAPWQSPIAADIANLRAMTGLDSTGQVSETVMDHYCAIAQKTNLPTTTLAIPSYEQALVST